MTISYTSPYHVDILFIIQEVKAKGLLSPIEYRNR